MKYIVTINDKNYEVEVEKGQASVVKTTQVAIVSEYKAVPVNADSVIPMASVQPEVGDEVVSGDPLKAPMPGTILAVNVHQGASVKKGDVLFILEAMKMETEITAPRDGVVSQINVAKGASVSTGDILLALQ
ncbi:MAG: biotin/lipoyl-containing protein [Bacillota bacterium]|nr:biotin/lipoyl-containing protein [Bacillota bacterium]